MKNECRPFEEEFDLRAFITFKLLSNNVFVVVVVF